MDSLLRTRFEIPKIGLHWVDRRALTDTLTQSLDKRVIMVSAPAGYGKTSLLAHWVHEGSMACAWLSLDPADNDLATFLTYFSSALQKVQPRFGEKIQALLKDSRLPPLVQLSTILINELSDLTRDVIVVLEDYHLIHDPAIHQLVAALVYHWPSRLHLVISTRTDPPLPLLQWRAHGYIVELRAINLRFKHEEADAFLSDEIGVNLPDSAVDDLLSLTEGWITGLKLVAIAIRDRVARNELGQQLEGVASYIQATKSNQQITDYLLEDVFSRQPKVIREFLMRACILDQFTAPLCDELGKDVVMNGKGVPTQATHILKWIERANLFIVPLDSEGRWYRFHHLFRELLAQQLRRKHDAAMIAGLHLRAGAWLEREGFVEEALQHYLEAGEPQRAADLILRHRHALLNDDNWRVLEHWLHLLPDAIKQNNVGLLMTQAWVLYIHGRTSAIAACVTAAMKCLPATGDDDPQITALHSELEALRGYLALCSGQFEEAIMRTRVALAGLSREHAYVRGSAMAIHGMSLQAAGYPRDAWQPVEDMSVEDIPEYGPAAHRALLTLALMACIAGEWEKARGSAEFALKLSETQGRLLLANWSHLVLGWRYYQCNELQLALEHFGAVTQYRYSGAHWTCVVYSLMGLAMTQQALGMPDDVARSIDLLNDVAHEGGEAGILTEMDASLAHLDLLRGQIAPASYWARTSSDKNDFRAMIWTEAPLVTRLHAFIADGTPESLAQAKAKMQPALDFARATQNIWRQVELMALQALLFKAENQTAAAVEKLCETLALAEPGRFIRVFVDLGDDMHTLLVECARRKQHSSYAQEILKAFKHPAPAMQHLPRPGASTMIEPLTARENEILHMLAQHFTNGEIASTLFISEVTVKSHLHNIYGKLGVNRRRFAIARAKAMGLLAVP